MSTGCFAKCRDHCLPVSIDVSIDGGQWMVSDHGFEAQCFSRSRCMTAWELSGCRLGDPFRDFAVSSLWLGH